MWRAGLGAVAVLLLAGTTAEAQWGGSPYGRGGYYKQQNSFSFWGGWGNDDYYQRRGPSFQSGGARPEIARLEPKAISFPSQYPVGSIVIDTKGRQLLLIKSDTEALHYPISVGRQGFTWTGKETISRKATWPDWHPPDEMRARDWKLPEKMSGGVKNPLGAMALYLGSSLYRIHGTNDGKSIGRAASSGCFRMHNGHIVDLSDRVDIGVTVQVVNRLPPELDKLVADQVRPPKEAATPKKRASNSRSNPG
jgi:lipoprotein-anchoring transpeptidase ErfK/SrfK